MNIASKAIAALALLTFGSVTFAQAPYPSGTVTLVNGFAAGGNPDVALRRIAARLAERLGQPVVVDNRTGAAGTIAALAVARAKPDGHTLLFGVAANLAVAPATIKPAPYDPATAFTPIVEIARGPYLWMVQPQVPAQTMREFVAWSKRQPGKVNYGSPGFGSVHHLAAEILEQAASLHMVHIPYSRGGMYPGLIGGDIDAMFDNLPGPLPHLKAGRIRALAVTGPKRLPALPDVPTLAEQGVAGIDVEFWWGFVGPAGMPRAVVMRLNDEVARILAEPDMKATFDAWGIEPSPGSPEAFGAQIAHEHARWRKFVATAGLKLD